MHLNGFTLVATLCLQPHRQGTFKFSGDPALVDKVRGVVGLYLRSPDRALVLCVDEKPQIQALERTVLVLPLRPGQPERYSHDYKRRGTLDLSLPSTFKAGTVGGAC